MSGHRFQVVSRSPSRMRALADRLTTVSDRARPEALTRGGVSLRGRGYLLRRNTGSTSPITRAERIISAPRIWTATSLSPASQ